VDPKGAGQDPAAVLDHLLEPLGGAGQSTDHPPPCVVLGGGVVRTGDVHDALEQSALAAEGDVDGLGRDPGVLGDRGDRRPGIAAVDEELTGRLEDPALGPLGLIGPQR
jgi:hypothetical protein